MIRKHTGYLGDALFSGGKNTTVTGDDAEFTVDDDGIDEAELTERGAELIDLLRGMGTGIVLIGYQFIRGTS